MDSLGAQNFQDWESIIHNALEAKIPTSQWKDYVHPIRVVSIGINHIALEHTSKKMSELIDYSYKDYIHKVIKPFTHVWEFPFSNIEPEETIVKTVYKKQLEYLPPDVKQSIEELKIRIHAIERIVFPTKGTTNYANNYTINEILMAVCRIMDVHPDMVKKKNRTTYLVLARQMIIFCARSLINGIPLTSICDIFDLDHSTVLYHIKEMKKRLDAKDTTCVILYNATIQQLAWLHGEKYV